MTENKMAKGTFYLMIAQFIFLGSGYFIHFALARAVKPAEYGQFGVILGLLLLAQIFLNMGIPEAVSKFISEGRDSKSVKIKSLKIQIIFSIFFFMIVFISAPYLASLLRDSELTNYIRFAAFIIPVRAIFSVFRGVLNGFRKFTKTATTNLINAVTRLVFALLFILLGFGIYGALGGFIVGAGIAMFFSIIFSMKNKKGKKISAKEIVNFSYPMIGFAACYTAIMNFDILFVKALVVNEAMIGYYTSAKTISSIIFGVAIALTVTLLPSVSKAFADKNLVRIKSYISESLRSMTIVITPILVILIFFSGNILTFLFPDEYFIAASSLSVLTMGVIFVTYFVILGSIINGSGTPIISFIFGLILLTLSGVLYYVLISRYGIIGGAYSVLIVGFLGLILFSSAVYKRFKELIKINTLLRVVFSGFVISLVSFVLDYLNLVTKISLIPFCFLIFGLYLLILIMVKELSIKEIVNLKQFFVKK